MASRCLGIPEIALFVCAQLRRSKHFGTLASLALTCSATREPALDVLWEGQESIIPLLKTFPQHVVMYGCLTLADDISEADWEHVQSYSRRIRRLTLEADDGVLFGQGRKNGDDDDEDSASVSVEFETVQQLQTHAGSDPLLPNLWHLDCDSLDSSWLPLIPLFLNPSLRSLRLCPGAEEESMAVLATFPSKCPNLVTFDANWDEVNDTFTVQQSLFFFATGNHDIRADDDDEASDGDEHAVHSSPFEGDDENMDAALTEAAVRGSSEEFDDLDRQIAKWQEGMRNTFSRWSSLVSVDLPDADPIILAHLGRSSVLETLKVAVLFESEWKPATELAFAPLKYLKITTATPMCPHRIMRSMSSTPLRLKTVEITWEDLHGGDSDENRRRNLDAIAECVDAASLQNVSYLQDYNHGPWTPTHWTALPGDAIVQFTRFPNIMRFDVHSLAAAWPKLRIFSLDVKRALHLGRARARKPTLASLISFAHSCPRLSAFGVVLDAIHIPPLPTATSKSKHRKRTHPLTFHLYGSPIRNATHVTDFVCSVFKNRTCIRFGCRKWSDGQASPRARGGLGIATFTPSSPMPTFIDRIPRYPGRRAILESINFSAAANAAFSTITARCTQQLEALDEAGPSDSNVLALRILHVLDCSNSAIGEVLEAEMITTSEEQRLKIAEYYVARLADVFAGEVEEEKPVPAKKRARKPKCVVIVLRLWRAARRARRRQH
ncbi:hypothetical protein HDZ31DRAFT_82966 [Schizophyllum fasciatum]